MIPELKFKGNPLTEETSKHLMSAILASKDGQEKPLGEDDELAKMFLAQILLKRIEFYPLPFTISNLFFIISADTFVDRPGLVMALLWLTFCYYKKTNKKYFGITEWCEIFPFGTPTEEELSIWWEAQKIEHKNSFSDNAVDNVENWK